MGLLNFLKGNNPNGLNKTETETSEMFYSLFNKRRKFDHTNFEEDKQVIAYRIYLHAFGRANKKAVPIEELLDPLAILKNSKVLRYAAIFNGISLTLDKQLNDNNFLNLNFNKLISDETILGIIKIVAENLKAF
jgi:hypothetical protein